MSDVISKVFRLLAEFFHSKLNELKHGKNFIRVKYFKHVKNWGDELNVYLIEKVTNMKVVHHPLGQNKHLLGIGSVIGSANRNSIIWGSGLIRETQEPKNRPLKICSVRGPKTRKILLDRGIDCPEIYGDPCLVLKKFYNPNGVIKKYKLGVVPHYVDKNNPIVSLLSKSELVSIIDIQQDIEPFIDRILECESIISSSLHGMIAADTYGIPNAKLELSDKVAGGAFKFDDYHLGIGVIDYPIISADILSALIKDGNIDKIVEMCLFKSISDEQVNKILSAFPYHDFSK